MWIWRAFIISFGIALFVAISSAPARALENSTKMQNFTISVDGVAVDLNSEFSDTCNKKSTKSTKSTNSTNSTNTFTNNTSLTLALLSDYVLPKQKGNSIIVPDNIDGNNNTPSKTSSSQIRFDPSVSLPPFERQAASAFGSAIQIDPNFVLVHEFLPEILGLKHFLAPLITSIAVPWYLRPDAANSHGRLAGWKDGNTLYTGTITYLS